jgi:phosphatidylethanolamine-binding protein (PEBP) family uncharacterized protein
MRRRHRALLAIGIAGGLVACGTSGRDLRVPQEGAVSPTRSVSTVATTVAPTTVAPVPVTLTLSSPAFPAGGDIPAESSCAGPSPALSWTGVTPAIKELALVVIDPEADGFVHWLVTGIKPSNASIPKGQVPPGATERQNSTGDTGWTGPCPPPGQTHTYNFILLGLTEPSALAPGLSPKDAVAALQTKARGNQALLSGIFTGTASGGSSVPGSVTPSTASGATTSTAAAPATSAKATTTP